MKRIVIFLIINSIAASNTIDAAEDGRLYYDRVFAPSEGFVSKVEKPYRQEICLNGQWDFQPVALPADYRQGKGIAPELPLPQNDKWEATKIKIPSPWNINSFANRNMEGPDHRNYPSYPASWENVKMAWMRRTVAIPADWDGNRILLHFEAVAGQTQVLVNGVKAAENFDLFLPFDADVTALVKAGEQAEILVGVRSQSLFEDNSTKGRRIVPAGSMWGYHINGVWQDVYLLAVPAVSVSNVFIKPLVSKKRLEIDVTVDNRSGKAATLTLDGDVREWLNKAGTDIHTAPVPKWELAKMPSATLGALKLKLPEGETKTTVNVDIPDGTLDFWTPEYPNLYGLTLRLSSGKKTEDVKYERFGWREWSFGKVAADSVRHCERSEAISSGKNLNKVPNLVKVDDVKVDTNTEVQLLNGKPYPLKGDSWHFMGVPQMTRRYAYAWFTALKDANANAVRPHAQVYPRFYFALADEMGICILAETANWASDGGPKMDAPLFWEHSKTHLQRMVLRDRNHPSVFGWSISNENKPVILYVFNKPEWMAQQKQAWQDWVAIVRENDPTRPWISSDGEDDGEGILPATVGHYGDENSLRNWAKLGKPWGVGETSMAYYGTPEQVAKFNGERAYESMLGRMEGLAIECYSLIRQQREAGASYSSVFNIAWYALQPLPFGKSDLTAKPSLDDGVWFGDYREGQPGVQPERIGAYCSTFNPGYDPTLPLFRPWPMFDAIKAAFSANSHTRHCERSEAISSATNLNKVPNLVKVDSAVEVASAKLYKSVIFFGADNSPVKQLLEEQNISFAQAKKLISPALIVIDGKHSLTEAERTAIQTYIKGGQDVWLWSPAPETLLSFQPLLPAPLQLFPRKASSFLPQKRSWLKTCVNSDFYFSEIQPDDAAQYALAGAFADEGETLLTFCPTDWRTWNKRPEELKTAAVLRSENEHKGMPDAAFVRYPAGASTFYVSTLDRFAASEKGFNTLRKILTMAGAPMVSDSAKQESLIDKDGFVAINKLLVNLIDNRRHYKLWVYSPRPLDDLLIEPDMPKLSLVGERLGELRLNGRKLDKHDELPLKQGWNEFDLTLQGNAQDARPLRFLCPNHPDFISRLQFSRLIIK
jgi:beta-galactosidase